MRIPIGIVRRVLDLTQEGRVAWHWESETEALAQFSLFSLVLRLGQHGLELVIAPSQPGESAAGTTSFTIHERTLSTEGGMRTLWWEVQTRASEWKFLVEAEVFLVENDFLNEHEFEPEPCPVGEVGDEQ